MNSGKLSIGNIFLIVCLLSQVACSKREEIARESTYTFNNKLEAHVNLDIYPTEKVYKSYTNRAGHYVINAGAKEQITLAVGKTYWIDWYSDDYSWNNMWDLGGSAQPGPKLQTAAVDDVRDITQGSRDTVRSVLLNGLGLSTSWTTTFMNVANQEETHQFIFRRNLSGQHSVIRSGDSSIEAITYYVLGQQTDDRGPHGFGINVVRSSDSKDIFRLWWIFAGSNSPVPETGRDTALLYPLSPITGQTTSTCYMMRRQ